MTQFLTLLLKESKRYVLLVSLMWWWMLKYLSIIDWWLRVSYIFLNLCGCVPSSNPIMEMFHCFGEKILCIIYSIHLRDSITQINLFEWTGQIEIPMIPALESKIIGKWNDIFSHFSCRQFSPQELGLLFVNPIWDITAGKQIRWMCRNEYQRWIQSSSFSLDLSPFPQETSNN